MMARFYERIGKTLIETDKRMMRTECFRQAQILYELANRHNRARYVFRKFYFY